MTTIGDVLRELTIGQRERLAGVRGVTPNGLANSYGGDWVTLIKDMKKDELARALKNVLDDNELRVVALRAFDGRNTELDRINWTADGEAPQRRQAIGIVKALCTWGPNALQTSAWENEIEPRLRDVGIEGLDRPARRQDLIRLRRIFR